MEETNDKGSKDSFGVEHNSKVNNWTAKVYMNGNGDKDDTEDKMKARLDSYINHLESKYGNKSASPL